MRTNLHQRGGTIGDEHGRVALCDHVIWLALADGTNGEGDSIHALEGEVFALRDSIAFRNFSIHPEMGNLSWPNEADYSPEFLYGKTNVTAYARTLFCRFSHLFSFSGRG